MSSSKLLSSAGLLGLTGVMLGAFGAHALHDTLSSRQMVEVWHTAVTYQLVHSVALLALAGWRTEAGQPVPKVMAGVAYCWLAGVVLFSGSLYALALGGPRALGPVTPIGGLLFLAGWTLVIIWGWRPPPVAPRV